MDSRIPVILFVLAVVFALLHHVLPKGRAAAAVLAELLTLAGVLAGLACGWTLERLGTPLLAVCFAALLGLVVPERGGTDG